MLNFSTSLSSLSFFTEQSSAALMANLASKTSMMGSAALPVAFPLLILGIGFSLHKTSCSRHPCLYTP